MTVTATRYKHATVTDETAAVEAESAETEQQVSRSP